MIANKPKWIPEHLVNSSECVFSFDLTDDSLKYDRLLRNERKVE